MNITDQFQKIGVFVAEDGFIPTLKEMSLFSVAPVEISGVTKLQPLHDFGQWYGLHLHQQMDMVTHQRIGIQTEPVP
jgi:hypothetical protein